MYHYDIVKLVVKLDTLCTMRLFKFEMMYDSINLTL